MTFIVQPRSVPLPMPTKDQQGTLIGWGTAKSCIVYRASWNDAPVEKGGQVGTWSFLYFYEDTSGPKLKSPKDKEPTVDELKAKVADLEAKLAEMTKKYNESEAELDSLYYNMAFRD